MARRLPIPRARQGATSSRRSRGSLEITGLRAVSEATIYGHVFGNADREVGGVLVGRMPADGGLPMVTGAIPAVSADERRATLTFTQDAWAHVHRVLDNEFPPDEQIVGWYHSHPGFGIFLSGHDLFIHENFFSSPSQVAVVVDPHARTEGAFVWRDQQLFTLFERPTPDRWAVSNAGSKAPGGRVPTAEASGAISERRGPRLGSPMSGSGQQRTPTLALVLAAVIGVLLGLGGWNLLFAGGHGASQSPAKQASQAASHRHARTRRPARTAPGEATIERREPLEGERP